MFVQAKQSVLGFHINMTVFPLFDEFLLDFAIGSNLNKTHLCICSLYHNFFFFMIASVASKVSKCSVESPNFMANVGSFEIDQVFDTGSVMMD